MPRRNRVDPWGDLHRVAPRGMFTGNRGCLVDDHGVVKRHHNGSLWIICQTEFRGWNHPLDAPRTWTPLFFLDDAVALAAGHRPCGLCRREPYLSYQAAVTQSLGAQSPVLAGELNRRLASERLKRGRGLDRASDRILWTSDLANLPSGTVVLDPESRATMLAGTHGLQPFSFAGWGAPVSRAPSTRVQVLTPPTSVGALRCGFEPSLHPTAEV